MAQYSTSPNRASVSFMSQPTSPVASNNTAPGLVNPFAQVTSQPQPGLHGYNTSANQLTNPFAQMTVSTQPGLVVGSPSQGSYLTGMPQANVTVGSPQNSYMMGTNGSSSFNAYSNPSASTPSFNSSSNGFGATGSNATGSNNAAGNPFAAPEPAQRNPFSDDFSSYKIKGADDFSKMTAEEIDQFTTKQRTLANTFGKYFYDETPNNTSSGHYNQPLGAQPATNNNANSNQKLYANPFDNQPTSQQPGANYNFNASNGNGNNNAYSQPQPQTATSPPKNVNPFL